MTLENASTKLGGADRYGDEIIVTKEKETEEKDEATENDEAKATTNSITRAVAQMVRKGG